MYFLVMSELVCTQARSEQEWSLVKNEQVCTRVRSEQVWFLARNKQVWSLKATSSSSTDCWRLSLLQKVLLKL